MTDRAKRSSVSPAEAGLSCALTPDFLDIGMGVFLCQLRHLSPELASELGQVAVPVDARGRHTNRDRAWYCNARCAVLAWSWFIDDGQDRSVSHEAR